MSRPFRVAVVVVALLATPAAAQRVPPADSTPYARAIAAGYKAAMLCSGLFVAGRTQAQVEAVELAGIYPEYDAIVPRLSATIDRRHGWVEVPYDAVMPPRRSEWQGGDTGCITLPPGAVAPPLIGDVLPLDYAAPPRAADARAWPLGDGGVRPRPGATLGATVRRAFDAATYGVDSTTVGVVVLRDGQVVAEHYADGFGPFTANRTWSAAKSIVGTLAGIVHADPTTAADIPEWHAWPRGDRRRTITLDHLLRMASGLHSDTAGNRTDAIYFGGAHVTDDATRWPLDALPGTRFRYANDDILLAMRSLRASLGEERYRFLPLVELFRPLGMSHTVAERDAGGNYILSSQVWSTARDLARLGQFWLQDGVWQGRRLLPEGWMRYMTTPSGPQPLDGPGYGATMWLFGPKQGLPEGSYAAQGNRGQYVMVIPAAKLVIVRRGEDPGAARFDIAKFSADVLAAVR